MKIGDIFKKVDDRQFIINAIENITYNEKGFAITNSTIDGSKTNFVAIDFGNKDMRYIPLDWLLMILSELYGKEYLIKALNEFNKYENIKNKEI